MVEKLCFTCAIQDSLVKVSQWDFEVIKVYIYTSNLSSSVVATELTAGSEQRQTETGLYLS